MSLSSLPSLFKTLIISIINLDENQKNFRTLYIPNSHLVFKKLLFCVPGFYIYNLKTLLHTILSIKNYAKGQISKYFSGIQQRVNGH